MIMIISILYVVKHIFTNSHDILKMYLEQNIKYID